MQAIDFFASRLQGLALNTPSVGDGICASHNAPATLYKVNHKLICRGCALVATTVSDRQGQNSPGIGKLHVVDDG